MTAVCGIAMAGVLSGMDWRKQNERLNQGHGDAETVRRMSQLWSKDGRGGLTVYVGINNYEYYTPSFCDGNYCCRDCEKCPIADKILEFEAEQEAEEEAKANE